MIVNTNRFQLTLKVSQVKKTENNRLQLWRERQRKLLRCCSVFCQETWFNVGESFAKCFKLKRCEKLESTTGKNVRKTLTKKVLPRSLGTSLSYSLHSFCNKVSFNFGKHCCKVDQSEKMEKIDIAYRKGVRENFHDVIHVAFQRLVSAFVVN